MMGRQTVDQSQLFYLFNLEKRIPARHLLRRINPTVTRILAEFREKLEPFYSEIGRFPTTRLSPSIATAGSAPATCSAKYSRRWCGRAWMRVWSRVRPSPSMQAS